MNAPRVLTKDNPPEEILKSEYKKLFVQSGPDYPDEFGNGLYKLQIFNNVGIDKGMFYNSDRTCEFCRTSHTGHCDLN